MAGINIVLNVVIRADVLDMCVGGREKNIAGEMRAGARQQKKAGGP